MSLIKWKKDFYNPWSIGRLQDEINKLFDFTDFPETTGLFDRHVSPPLDVVETNESYVVKCDLPGIKLEDIDISIANNVLTIKGEKKYEKKVEDEKIYKKETWDGSFQRTLSLPNSIDVDKVEAVLKDGILKISLPKHEDAKPKTISVKTK